MIIDGIIETALANASIDGNKLVLVDKLERKSYLRANEILETLGGKWSRKDKAHVFPEGGEDLRSLISVVIETGEIKTAREQQKALGWFPTPPGLARELVRLADIRLMHNVLEPSAGEGAIVEAIIEALGGEKRKKLVDTVEIDPARRAKLKARFPEDIHILGDFLTIRTDGRNDHDRIVMNPPFGPHLAHVEHALDMLRQDSDVKLVSVLPASVQYREDKKHQAFRDMLTKRARSHSFEPLPDDSFKESGTQVRTCVLVVDGLL